DVRIGPVIDVVQPGLWALEQYPLALAPLAAEQRPDGVHEWQHLRGDTHEVVVDGSARYLGQAEAAPQRVVMCEQSVDLAAQAFEIGEIHQADRAAPDLVLVGRTDAALGRADALAR